MSSENFTILANLLRKVLKARHQHALLLIFQGTADRLGPILGTDFQALLR
jgi:hypothetical protein